MKKWLTLFALGLPFTAAADNTAASGFYAGAGATSIELKASSEKLDDWVAVEGFAGYKHSPFVGGEVRVGAGSSDADIIYTSFYYRTESANDIAKMYLLLGYTIGQLKNDDLSADVSDTADINGLSYGAGVSFLLSNTLNVNLEYRMVLDGDLKFDWYVDDQKYRISENAELSGFTVSVDYRF